MLCLIFHVLTLAFADDAFDAPRIRSPSDLFRLGVKPGLRSQTVPWKPHLLHRPLFVAPEKATNSPDKALSYAQYHRWLTRLGAETGFVQILTTYCLRRATGNAVNGEQGLPTGRSKTTTDRCQTTPSPTWPCAIS